MGVIELKQRGADLNRLVNVRMRRFCLEMMIDPTNQTQAAVRAGYSEHSAHRTASKLMKNPIVKAVLGKFQREREERTQLTSDDVWDKLHQVLALDPLEFMEPSREGWWIVKDLTQVPSKIRRMIQKIKIKPGRRLDNGQETEPTIEVELMSKDNALNVAARHSLVQRHEVGPMIDWDSLPIPGGSGRAEVIETQIEGVGESAS